MVKNSQLEKISLDGGRVSLDFVNTVHERKTEPLNDYLSNVFDLIFWAVRAGILTKGHATILEQVAMKEPKNANAFFKEAISFREGLYRLFFKFNKNVRIRSSEFDDFNQVLQSYFSLLELGVISGSIDRNWKIQRADLRWIIAPIVMDAYELLLLGKLNRLKECPKCGWLFLDGTKNGKRRWCNMKACGSNVKALEWYHRNKEK